MMTNARAWFEAQSFHSTEEPNPFLAPPGTPEPFANAELWEDFRDAQADGYGGTFDEWLDRREPELDAEPRAKIQPCASMDGHRFRHITDDIYRCENCGLEDAR